MPSIGFLDTGRVIFAPVKKKKEKKRVEETEPPIFNF